MTDEGGLPRTFVPGGIHAPLLDDVPEMERHARVEEWFRKARHPSLTRGQAERRYKIIISGLMIGANKQRNRVL